MTHRQNADARNSVLAVVPARGTGTGIKKYKRGTGLRHSRTGRGTGSRIKSTGDCVMCGTGTGIKKYRRGTGSRIKSTRDCVVCGTLLESVMYCYCYRVPYGYLVLVVLCDPLVHHIHHKPYNAVGQYSSIFV